MTMRRFPLEMRRRVSEFRFCNVLPDPIIDDYAGMAIKAIRFLPGFNALKKWWEYEREVEIDFENSTGDESEKIRTTCGACGACCRDIPTHQIAIYMSAKERREAQRAGHRPQFQGHVMVVGRRFGIMAVKENGDCAMLGPKGCTLGDYKPLWCKIYHCEKYQGRPYQFEEKHADQSGSQVSSLPSI